ncbi:MAG: helix-turn-helix domain-containing protein [Tunicatimonas sp.]
MSESTTNLRILHTAESLFFQYGIRSVTMEDIAKELSISKKTIYQYFKDKDEIVLKVSKQIFVKELAQMHHIHEQCENVIHEMVLISRYIRQHVAEANPSAMHDMQKFYPEAWRIFLTFKSECLNLVESTIRKGMSEGYFRPEVNPKILAILRSETIELSFNQQLFPRHEFEPQEVQGQLFEQFINGILTSKGRKLYHKYTQEIAAS